MMRMRHCGGGGGGLVTSSCKTARPCCATRSMRPDGVMHRRTDRRWFLADAILLPMVLGSMPAIGAEEETVVTKTVPVKPKLFIARDFLFAYPRGWKLVEDTENGDSMTDRRRQNVVRGEVVSPDGVVTVSVIQQQASKLKQSLFQITDISQLGSIEEVSKLVLPPGSRIDGASVRTFPIAPKDTGTVVGVIERDPVVVYRYSVRLSNGVRSEVAAGIILGRVLILGAGCMEENWQDNQSILKAIADSFKILPKQS